VDSDNHKREEFIKREEEIKVRLPLSLSIATANALRRPSKHPSRKPADA
jgi:hypothetical protein